MDAIRDADAAVETQQIGATAEEHVLAVVDDLIDSGMQIRRSSPAQIASLLDQLHTKASLCQSAGRAHASYAASDDGDSLLRVVLQSGQYPTLLN
jgi:hypothetical protein